MGLPIARILGIEVRLQLGWVIVIALVAVIAEGQVAILEPTAEPAIRWLVGGVVAFGFLCSAVLHDLAHAVVARRAGIATTVVAVSFFGGATPLDPASDEAGPELRIAVAGPVASLAAAAVLTGLALVFGTIGGTALELAGAILIVLAVLNGILGGVNLIPGYPLDGGRIVRAAAWLRSGDVRRGWMVAAVTGRLSGFIVIAGGLAIAVNGDLTNGAMIGLCGWFLVLSARTIADRTKVEALIGDLRVRDVMEVDGPTVTGSLTVDTFAAQLLGGEDRRTAIAVLDDGALVGVIGIRQVERIGQKARATTKVEAAMVPLARLPRVSVDESLARAAERLTRSGVDGLPVFDGDAYAGLLTRYGVGRIIHERGGARRR